MYPYNPVFLILSTVRSYGIFPINNGVGTISESFTLNLIIYLPLTNK